ncbi:MAG: MFS transporter [Candidatus Aenigmarchaeota archaeon]|nr:MFS transporter [Candidatus Aenigmarchaeota archaeon]
MHINFLNIHRLVSLSKEMKEIYLNRLLQSFSLSLIGMFVPIHLMRIGYSLNQAILYLIMLYGGMMIFIPFASKISSKIGIKHTIAITFPAWLLYFYLLFSLKFPSPLFLLIGAIYGFANVVYWVPLNSDFSRNSHKMRLGTEFGILKAIPLLVGAFAPMIGAVVITFFGFDNLIAVVCILLGVSLIPLFLTGDYKFNFGYSLKKMFDKKHLIFFKDFFMKGILFASNVIWPIYVFVSFGSKGVIDVGLAATLGALGSMFFTLIIGRMSDKYSKMKLLKIGGLSNFFIWILAIVFVSPLSIMILSFIKGFLFVLIDLPMFVIACEQTNNRNNVEFMAFREFGLCLGRLSLLLIILFVALEIRFFVVFLLAALASLYFFLSKIS